MQWRTDGGDRRGSLHEIAAYYRSLGHGRLVVVGEPGAGKTVLALQLVIDLLGTSPRVPVRLSLPTFAVGDLDTAPELAERLDAWIAGQIERDFGFSARLSRDLARHGRVLPVLDGLDEMDAEDANLGSSTSLSRQNTFCGK